MPFHSHPLGLRPSLKTEKDQAFKTLIRKTIRSPVTECMQSLPLSLDHGHAFAKANEQFSPFLAQDGSHLVPENPKNSEMGLRESRLSQTTEPDRETL